MRSAPIYVLGTGLSHDGSACLLRDGRVAVAIEKERLTRRKHDGSNDSAAIEYCLAAEGISLKDISVIVQNGNFSMFAAGNSWFHGRRLFSSNSDIVTISHHLAHAYSSVGQAPFSEAAILVIDGCGSGLDDCVDLPHDQRYPDITEELRHLYYEKDSLYHFKDGVVTPVYKDFSCWGHRVKEYPMHPPTTLHSIGGIYQAVSSYVFQGMDDSGKLMGLAPYGSLGRFGFDVFRMQDGRIFLNYEWLKNFTEPCRSEQDFKAHFQYYADLALWLQVQIEQALLYLLADRRRRCNSENLCYAGGVALNAVANGKLLKSGAFSHIYIQPAAGDNGLALGCAYYGWMAILGKERVVDSSHTYFGKVYPPQRFDQAIHRYSKWVYKIECDNYLDKTAEMLAAGDIVGWYQKGSEFGPRALGNRSILADPRSPTVRDTINRTIKFREDFRPFAPSVLEEDVNAYFQCTWMDPFMLTVVPVKNEVRTLIPSVVHHDGSARIQTVSAQTNPAYHGLISKFKERTGIALLLNTSLNKRGMPIVETPEQALHFFLTTGLTVLVLENTIYRKRDGEAYPVEYDLTGIESLLTSVCAVHATDLKAIGGLLKLTITGSMTWYLDLDQASLSAFQDGASGTTNITIHLADDFHILRRGTAAATVEAIQAGRINVEGDVTTIATFLQLLSLDTLS